MVKDKAVTHRYTTRRSSGGWTTTVARKLGATPSWVSAALHFQAFMQQNDALIPKRLKGDAAMAYGRTKLRAAFKALKNKQTFVVAMVLSEKSKP
jgi:hypothetical protein